MPRSTHTALWIALALTAPIVLMSFAGIAPRILPSQGPASASVSLLPDATPLFHVIPTKGGHGGGGGGSGGCTTTLPAPNGVAYAPAQVQKAYNYNTAVTGTGETIAIIDAYGDKSISSDLACFDQTFGLPAPPSLTVTVVGGSLRGSNSGWAMETALDVEWAHAMAPGAKILLLVTPSSSFTYMVNDAVPYAVSHGAKVISMSWGAAESSIGCSTENTEDTYFADATQAGAILVGASGDSGANDGTHSPTVDYPAADPNVVGAGGTDLATTASGAWGSEVVWNDASGATGGGVSTCFSEPAYQASAGIHVTTSSGSSTPTGRAVPDVSYDASPYTGFWVWVGGTWNQVGGTSDAAPQWAAIFADAQSAGASVDGANVHSAIYSLPSSDIHDITSGNNGYYYASAGYDACTGIGTPIEGSVISGL